MSKQVLSARKAPKSRSMGEHVKQVIPSATDHLDPFVFLDHFGAFQKPIGGLGVPPHPHAGIATITYLFEGTNRHQDSYGHDVVIRAGDLAWMQAGRGIVHSEGMDEGNPTPETLHGVQIWISLPAKDKFIEPDFFFYPAKDLPVFEHAGAQVKVICGELLGHSSPVRSLSPAFIYEVKIPAHTQFSLPIAQNDSCGVYLVSGSLNTDDGHTLQPSSIAKFANNSDELSLQATSESHFLILGGKPLNEPIFAYGSYVMNSREQIIQVMNDYEHGKMGYL
jgi:redox-sensitive bicupin YhaK (pirin superfamily)